MENVQKINIVCVESLDPINGLLKALKDIVDGLCAI